MTRTTDKGPTRSETPAGALERELLRRAQAGDRAAFEGLIRAHYRRVYASSFHLLGNPEDAEDLAQECFVRAFGALASFRGEAPFAAWLHRIVCHLARDRFRASAARPREGELVDGLRALGLGPWRELSSRELVRQVSDAVERLPEELRLALLLRTQEGASYEDIARATDVTPGTARTRVMKARKHLRRLLAPLLEGDDA